jgi:hypothetical protein
MAGDRTLLPSAKAGRPRASRRVRLLILRYAIRPTEALIAEGPAASETAYAALCQGARGLCMFETVRV